MEWGSSFYIFNLSGGPKDPEPVSPLPEGRREDAVLPPAVTSQFVVALNVHH